MDGRLYLSGINEEVHDQFVRTGELYLSGPLRVYEATPVRLEAARKAIADARAWLVRRNAGNGSNDDDAQGARVDPQG